MDLVSARRASTPLAVVVLAHADPGQLRRLVAALDEIPIFLHCDRTTSADVFGAMTRGLPSRVQLCPRVATQLASWSLVEAELRALHEALQRTTAAHIAVVSGACYPLVPVSELLDRLDPWTDRMWQYNMPMPLEHWNSPGHQDGGMWRLRHRFFTRDDNIVTVGDIPLRLPWRRSLPRGVAPRAGSQWKIYSRVHAQALLAAVDDRPDIVRFWRHTLVPDETFVSSVLGSPELLGDLAVPDSRDSPMFSRWDDGAYHPNWLGELDIAALEVARKRAVFARKFSATDSGGVLDWLDREAGRPARRDSPGAATALPPG